jgi:hypothetical protein
VSVICSCGCVECRAGSCCDPLLNATQHLHLSRGATYPCEDAISRERRRIVKAILKADGVGTTEAGYTLISKVAVMEAIIAGNEEISEEVKSVIQEMTREAKR